MTNHEVERLKNLILSMYVDVYDDDDRYYNKALYDVIGKLCDDDVISKICDEERPTGEWIYHGNRIECNQCRAWFLKDFLIRNSFCPNCGADMRGEDN